MKKVYTGSTHTLNGGRGAAHLDHGGGGTFLTVSVAAAIFSSTTAAS